jgi:hypothetical protein
MVTDNVDSTTVLRSATGHPDDAGVTNYVVETHCFNDRLKHFLGGPMTAKTKRAVQLAVIFEAGYLTTYGEQTDTTPGKDDTCEQHYGKILDGIDEEVLLHEGKESLWTLHANRKPSKMDGGRILRCFRETRTIIIKHYTPNLPQIFALLESGNNLNEKYKQVLLKIYVEFAKLDGNTAASAEAPKCLRTGSGRAGYISKKCASQSHNG